MLILNGAEVHRLLPMKKAVEEMKKAFVFQSSGQTRSPVRTGFNIEGVGETLFMPAWVHAEGADSIGIKIVSVFPRNAEAGLPVVPAQMILLDEKTGMVAAIINGTELTKIRTGALAGAATDILARKDAKIAALFGTGGQARAQLEALWTVRELEEVRIFDSVPERIDPFIEMMTPSAFDRSVKLVAAWSGGAAVDGAEIITTVTTSRTPTFNGTRVNVGTHVNGVGSFTPKMRELDENLLRSARVFVDNREAVLAEAGDILIPESRGTYARDRIVAELGDVLTGKIEGRTSEEDITVFKTVGFAVPDVVAARAIYDEAVKEGAGQRIAN